MKNKILKALATILLSLICAAATLIIVIAVGVLLGIGESVGTRGLAAGMAIGMYTYTKRIFNKIIYDRVSIKTAILHPLAKSIIYKDSQAAEIIGEQVVSNEDTPTTNNYDRQTTPQKD